MSIISIAVISVVMFCAVVGAVASRRDSEKGLGKEFLDGLHAIDSCVAIELSRSELRIGN